MEPFTLTLIGLTISLLGLGISALSLLYRKLDTDTKAANQLSSTLAVLNTKVESVVDTLKTIAHTTERTEQRVKSLEIEHAVLKTEVTVLQKENT